MSNWVGAGMVLYRRNLIAGGTYFFTLTLNDRRSDLLVRHVDKLRASWKSAQIRVPHRVIAAVVMPEHLHAVIEMPQGTSDYARLWQDVKKGFTRRILDADITVPKHGNGEYALWQRRYWEHTIRDEADLVAHIDYLHFNPVKHGHVLRVRDWPHSSFHRFVAEGKLAIDWGDTPPTEPAVTEFGE